MGDARIEHPTGQDTNMDINVLYLQYDHTEHEDYLLRANATFLSASFDFWRVL